MPLNVTVARNRIDLPWWADVDDAVRHGEGDSEWEWARIVKKVTWKRHRFECVALCTADEEVQGAARFRLEAPEEISAGNTGVEIEFVATAPWNRMSVVGTPRYNRVGTRLIQRAAVLSCALHPEPRVFAVPLDKATGFYRRLGFVPTAAIVDEQVVYELPEPVTRKLAGESHDN